MAGLPPTGESEVTTKDVDAALHLVQIGAVAPAMQHVKGLLQRGVSPDDVIGRVLVPVQARVGTCWEEASWSVAQEHAATSVVETMLSMVTARSDTTGWRGRVVVACVEDERHSLPSRMMNERLRLRGWETVFLGSSTPADDLQAYLESSDFHAVVASAQTPLSLFGAGRTIRGSHRAGVPVVIGGAALGVDGRRARNLGADAWCANIDKLDTLLEGWVAAPPETFGLAVSDEAEHLVLLSSSAELIAAMTREVASRWPTGGDDEPMQQRQARQDLRFIVEFLAASVLTADHRLMSDFLEWLWRVLDARNAPLDLLAEAFDTLASNMPSDLHRTHAIVNAVRPMLRRP